jgi:hypothetical protein
VAPGEGAAGIGVAALEVAPVGCVVAVLDS